MRSEFSEYHASLREGRTTVEKTVRDELANISSYNRKLNAFITLFGGEKGVALSRARELDARVEKKKSLAKGLFGVPLAIKDNIAFGGFRTTDATYYFRDYIPESNADIVDDGLAEGCVPLGKTNLHEIALGATSAASYFGPVRHPRDPSRVSGGSSGGSAVAVAKAKGPLLGLGTDTGGSIRVPAALCGVMGFKPTLGILSLEGVFPLSATLDHGGLLTRTMPDMVSSFSRLAGRKARRSSSQRVRVVVLGGHFLEESEEVVSKNFWRALDRMVGSGRFVVSEVKADSNFERFTAARGAIQLREAAWFYKDLVSSKEASAKMNGDVLTLLRRGMKVGRLRYMAANLERLEAIREFGRLLKAAELIAMPTTRIVAPKLEEVLGKEAGRLRRLLLQNTEVFNLCGFPALSIPSNPGANQLPTSLQLAGGLGEDEGVLEAGEAALRAISRSA